MRGRPASRALVHFVATASALGILCGAPSTQAGELAPELRSPDCVACRVDAATLRSGFEGDERARLDAGEVVIADTRVPGSGESLAGSATAAAIVPHTPAEVWSVLVDFEARPRFMPHLETVELLRSDGNRIWLRQEFDIAFTRVRMTLIQTLDPRRGEIAWLLDPAAQNDIADTRGSWQIAPLEAGARTLLVYRTRLETGRAVPAFVERILSRRSLPGAVEAVRREVDRRAVAAASAPLPDGSL